MMKVGWKTVMKQQKLVEKMTIEEKAAILSGKTVWQSREIDRLSNPSPQQQRLQIAGIRIWGKRLDRLLERKQQVWM